MSNKPPAWSPYNPPSWELADAGAFRAVAKGEANPDQQKRMMDFLIKELCRTYDVSFCPGPDGDRETAMAEGRRFVGLQVVKLLNVDTSKLKKGEN